MLQVHGAERADRLADGLALTLLEPLEDPFAPDVVAVPTRGIERWLSQRLSTRLGTGEDGFDGVCAKVEFPFPGRLVLGALASATGLDPEDDRWLAERLVWPLLEVVDPCLDEPWLATLAAHLDGARGEPEDPTRSFGVVRRIADVFDHYAVHRPEMLRSWASGEGSERSGAPGSLSCGGGCGSGSRSRAPQSGLPSHAGGSARNRSCLTFPRACRCSG
jgi:exodeoxyribonuclease V gamma subunit